MRPAFQRLRVFGRRSPLAGLMVIVLLVSADLAVGQDEPGSASDVLQVRGVGGQREFVEEDLLDEQIKGLTQLGELAKFAQQAAGGQAEQAPAPLPVTGLVASLTIFVLAIFIGFEIITKVPPTLHTPLMSGSNAISGITIVGALLVTGSGKGWLPPALGVVALILATINVVGGFLVTHRMLAMFKRKK